jgi:uncharacterized alkaline shock family protein YloU
MSNPITQTTQGTQKTQEVAKGNALEARASGLVTEEGNTTIADVVVQKVAGLATREISGVHALGGGSARVLGAIRDRIPGASASAGQGVSVEVGEKQAAVDLEIVVEYGVPINNIAKAVRRNVTTAIEQITGLEVVEVNINVNDVYLPGEDDAEPETSRVQ